MKRTVIALAIVVALALSLLSGCCSSGSSGGKAPQNATPTPALQETGTPAASDAVDTVAPTPAPEPEKTDVVIGEVATLKGMALQVTKVEKSQGTTYDKPKDGKEYVIVHILIKNVGDSVISYNPFYFKMKNSNGQITDADFTLVASDSALNAGELLPGGLVSGSVPFEQPKDDPALSFIYEDVSWFSDKQLTVDLSKTAEGIKPLEQDEIKVGDEKIVNAGEENSLDGATITLTKVTRSAGSDFSKPKEGNEFIIVEVTIKNTGTENLSYNPFNFKMRNSKGQMTDMTISLLDQDTALESGELAAGGSVTGTMVFEQPKGDSALVLVYQSNMFLSDYIAFKIP